MVAASSSSVGMRFAPSMFRSTSSNVRGETACPPRGAGNFARNRSRQLLCHVVIIVFGALRWSSARCSSTPFPNAYMLSLSLRQDCRVHCVTARHATSAHAR
eukprot:656743-Pyramimonas_sp.AAC.2